VAGETRVRVKLPTGTTYPVQGLVGWDASRDFALLKIEAKNLPTVPLGDSDKVRQGDRVLTLGSPLGLEQTASEGIVSAVRDLPDSGRLIQTTAAVSPGSSGGPVLNMRGEAIGIASFMLTEGQSLNFVVPINYVKPRLATTGKVTPLAEAVRTEFAGSAAGLFLAGLLALPDVKAPGAQKQFEQALALFRQAVEKRKDYAQAWYEVGYCLENLGRWQEAIDAYKQAIRLKPDDAEAYFDLGLAYGKMDRWQDSVDAYKQAIRLKLDYAEAHVDFHWGPYKRGNSDRWHQAIDVFRKVIPLKPDDAEAHFGLGLAYWMMNDWQDAVNAFKEAIRLKPDYALAHYFLGSAYISLGRPYQDAVDAYKQAIRLKPDYAPAHLSLGMTYISISLTSIGLDRWQDAADAFKEAIRLKPDYADAYGGLGSVYSHLGRLQDAVDAYKEAIRLNPYDESDYSSLGFVYEKLDRWQDAVDAFKEAVRLSPDDADAHYALGSAYVHLGDRGRALDEYKILKDLGSSSGEWKAYLAGRLFKELYP